MSPNAFERIHAHFAGWLPWRPPLEIRKKFLISASVWTGDEFVIKKRRENIIEGELLISRRLQGRQQVQLTPLTRQLFRAKCVQISKKAIG